MKNSTQFFFRNRIGLIEARSCDDMLSLDGEHTKIDIIKWNRELNKRSESCFSLAYFEKSSECYELSFCGSRPFDLSESEREVFWKLANQSRKLLEDFFTPKEK